MKPTASFSDFESPRNNHGGSLEDVLENFLEPLDDRHFGFGEDLSFEEFEKDRLFPRSRKDRIKISPFEGGDRVDPFSLYSFDLRSTDQRSVEEDSSRKVFIADGSNDGECTRSRIVREAGVANLTEGWGDILDQIKRPRYLSLDQIIELRRIPAAGYEHFKNRFRKILRLKDFSQKEKKYVLYDYDILQPQVDLIVAEVLLEVEKANKVIALKTNPSYMTLGKIAEEYPLLWNTVISEVLKSKGVMPAEEFRVGGPLYKFYRESDVARVRPLLAEKHQKAVEEQKKLKRTGSDELITPILSKSAQRDIDRKKQKASQGNKKGSKLFDLQELEKWKNPTVEPMSARQIIEAFLGKEKFGQMSEKDRKRMQDVISKTVKTKGWPSQKEGNFRWFPAETVSKLAQFFSEKSEVIDR